MDLNIKEKLDSMTVFELRHLAGEQGFLNPSGKKKVEMIEFLLSKEDFVASLIQSQASKSNQNSSNDRKKNASPRNNSNGRQKDYSNDSKDEDEGDDSRKFEHSEMEIREGVLEICPDGYGFLRAYNYEQGDGDAYISATRIRKSGLRKGDLVKAYVKKLAENRPMNVQEIIQVNNLPTEKAFDRPAFETLIPIHPDSRFKLELPGIGNDMAIRAIDLVSPIGKGQRGMIVSPPKAGKTTLLKRIAHSVSSNYPEAHLIVLLIDERPEEVTDMQRSIRGEVVFSTFDEMPEHHTKASEMVLERAKRLVELGKDVVILMDSLTRLARAYNLVISPTGKTLSGGIDPGALHSPKRFFGAARNIENGGSLTIIATALVDTGSRMDDVIYEEFKGTGNMEIHLDRKLSEKRIFPAIDLNRSGTRREELLLDSKELEGIWAVRKILSVGDVQEATENLISMMIRTGNNAEFISQLSLQIQKLQKEGYSLR
ncbi:MAG: hypothetical protein BWX72_00889 [Firmicutes bacterium ADurb.Bin080]|nr:transcription termination factor Rho [Clostridiales bacterium]OQC15562.1 MAG: hypothetical protein BWX72_00889 [Firmicutes bacterium ADurb.Bin080]